MADQFDRYCVMTHAHAGRARKKAAKASKAEEASRQESAEAALEAAGAEETTLEDMPAHEAQELYALALSHSDKGKDLYAPSHAVDYSVLAGRRVVAVEKVDGVLVFVVEPKS